MIRNILVFRVPKGKDSIRINATIAAAYYFFYENSFEAIGHCFKSFFGEGFWLDNAILLLIAMLGIVPFVLDYLRIKNKKGLILPVLLLFALFVSVFSNHELLQYITPLLFPILICCLFYVVYSYAFYDLLIIKILKQRWLLLFLFIVTSLLLREEGYISSAKQVISYNIANLSVLFFISFSSVKNKASKIIDFTGYCVSLVLILMMSSRGAFIAALFATGLILVSYYRLFGISLLLFSIFVVNFETFLSFIKSILDFLHIDSRIHYYLSSANFFAQEGRGLIYDSLLNVVNEHHLVGGGIGFDRFIIHQSTGIDTYSHNLVLEILCQFGWLLGVIILLTITFLYLYPLLRKDLDNNIRILVCLFSVRGFICLLFSGSYLSTYEFFVLMSVGIAALQSLRRKSFQMKPE